MRTNVIKAVTVAAAVAMVVSGCGSTKDAAPAAGSGGSGKVGATVPLLTSPFWQAYNNYVPNMAQQVGVDALPTVNADSDPAKLITDMNNLLNQGVKGLIVTPLDSAAVVAGLNQAERKGVPVVAVDVAPEGGIVAAGPEQLVSALSGGNQQKVVLARALARDPRVLVLINPTAGVDVKSKEALLAVVDRVRAEGRAVLIVSDELDDLRPSDRVLVMRSGRLVAEHRAGWSDGDLVADIEGVELDG